MTTRDSVVEPVPVWTKLSFHCAVNGPQVTTAEIVAVPPEQTVPPPATLAVGDWRTVIATLPDTVPTHPLPSVRDVSEYVVSTAGATALVMGLACITWAIPSDHVRFQGGCPVRLTERFVGWPEQAVVGPVRAAVDFGRIGTARFATDVQPFNPVTVTARVTLPDAPAVES